MVPDNLIGEFLKARRQFLRPDEVGLPDLGNRRVPGLRREELAALAGVSADYYTRLEQGRDHHPSEQVLDSLARALMLDEEATAHLHRLARPARRRRRGTRRPERVQPGIQGLIDSWPGTPAFVWGRYMDVLAANRLAVALAPMYAPGANLVRSMFLDPGVRGLYPDWETLAGNVAAVLRALAGPDLDDPTLNELIGEVSVRSAVFARLWARHDARRSVATTKVFAHPLVGRLELHREALTVAGDGTQTLVAYHAEPGSPSADALTLLATMAVNSPEPQWRT